MDWPWICAAFLFLVLAAGGQIIIPRLTGLAIDSVAFSGVVGNKDFEKYIVQLCIASVVTGVCSGQ